MKPTTSLMYQSNGIDVHLDLAYTEDIANRQTMPVQAVTVRGKFFYVGEEKFTVKGVTYGPFAPDEDGQEYFDETKTDRDCADIIASGFNVIRTYTTPPARLLDIAWRHGLRVMVSLTCEQFARYLIDGSKAPDYFHILRQRVRDFADHPALLCIALGNEIPATMVRWLGPRRAQRYLKRIYKIVKEEAPDAIVTYVNYPTTEYLQLPFLDMLCFNVYLETPDKMEAYLAKLQNIAGNRPLILGEVGLDSLRNGVERQAQVLDWQIRLGFRMGCAGMFLFSWTDEWFRGGQEIHDWAFGLTDRERKPKPALSAAATALADVPVSRQRQHPMVSVIVCTYNGGRTLRECLEGLRRMNYPNYEVIIVNDGSTDNTALIASDYPFQLITTANQGLSNARNTGAEVARGEIVVYLDDDAIPDPDWLLYITDSFENPAYAAVGGPNIAPLDASFVADCVDHAPGTPTHVLYSDREAEHIPGCNFAIRRDLLLQMGGFDSRFRAAGDDVDLCWRLEDMGWKIGFNGAAMIWHHRRSTVRSYLKQQIGYGKAEALLERKWPQKYNTLGHKTWHGRIYSNGALSISILNRWKIYHGIWGSAPFQSVYGPGNYNIFSFTLMPEWYLFTLTLIVLSAFGLIWSPLLYLVPAAVLSAILPLVHIVHFVIKVSYNSKFKGRGIFTSLRWHALTILLHIMQPLVRLYGRIRHRLTPWRKYSRKGFSVPIPGKFWVWCENWRSPESRLENIELSMKEYGANVARGGDFSRWDFQISGGGFGSVLVALAVEDLPLSQQLLHFRQSNKLSPLAKYILLFFSFLLTVAIMDHSWIPAIIFGAFIMAVLLRATGDCARAAFCLKEAIKLQN
jgi:O-antigen biosynthesis protein